MLAVYRKGKKTGKTIPLKAKAQAMVSKVPLNPIQKRQVHNLIKRDDELKQFAQGANSLPYFNAGGSIIQALILPTQGVGDNQRAGDTIKISSIKFRYQVTNGTGAGSNPSGLHRLVFFQYNMPNTVTLPTAATMFLTGAGAGTVNAYSTPNRDYTHIFKVLSDTTFRTVGGIGAGTTALPANYSHSGSVYVPIRRAIKKIQFVSGNTTCVDQIYFLLMSDAPSNTINPQLSWDCNVRFTDA